MWFTAGRLRITGTVARKIKSYAAPIDIWLIDGDYDNDMALATAASKPTAVLVGFSQAPYLNEAQQYAKWQRKLKRKLAQMLALPMLVDNIPYEKNTAYENEAKDWHYVVFLGASMGGPSAVKEFFRPFVTCTTCEYFISSSF